MNTELEKQLKALIGKIKEEFYTVRVQLLKRGIESLLKGEMTAHLGYEKGSPATEGNQRNGFSEKTIKTPLSEVCNFGLLQVILKRSKLHWHLLTKTKSTSILNMKIA